MLDKRSYWIGFYVGVFYLSIVSVMVLNIALKLSVKIDSEGTLILVAIISAIIITGLICYTNKKYEGKELAERKKEIIDSIKNPDNEIIRKTMSHKSKGSDKGEIKE